VNRPYAIEKIARNAEAIKTALRAYDTEPITAWPSRSVRNGVAIARTCENAAWNLWRRLQILRILNGFEFAMHSWLLVALPALPKVTNVTSKEWASAMVQEAEIDIRFSIGQKHRMRWKMCRWANFWTRYFSTNCFPDTSSPRPDALMVAVIGFGYLTMDVFGPLSLISLPPYQLRQIA